MPKLRMLCESFDFALTESSKTVTSFFRLYQSNVILRVHNELNYKLLLKYCVIYYDLQRITCYNDVRVSTWTCLF